MSARSAAMAVTVHLPAAPTVGVPSRVLERQGAPERHRASLRRARGIAEALFSTSAGPPPANRLAWIERELSALLDKAGWRSGGIYKLGLFLVSWLAPLFALRLGPLARLPLATRVEALRRMERSFAAAVLLAVKAILCILYYEHADAARDAGYRGACADGGLL